MLGRKFILIDGVQLPTPTQGPKITMKNLESVMTSEAGTDLVDVIRLEKKSIACTFQTTSLWKKKLEDIGKEPTVYFQMGQDTAFLVRPRVTKVDMFNDSHIVDGTDGLWTIQMLFEEV